MRKIWTLFMASTLFLSPISILADEGQNTGIILGQEGNPEADNPEGEEIVEETVPNEMPKENTEDEQLKDEMLPEQELPEELLPELPGEPSPELPGESLPELGSEDKVILTLDSTTVLLYGEMKELLLAPKVVAGRTYLPLRFVGEEILEAKVDWNQETRQITVEKEGKEVILSTTEPKAWINGEEIIVDAMPIVENGTTLLPVRFMSEQFELLINYVEATRTIEIEKPVVIPNTPPVAAFEFLEESYIAGQTVQVQDMSFDPDGHFIKETLWMIDGNPMKTAASLDKIFKTPKQGYYEISLKVRDEKGLWSEWVSQMIMILPNEAPEVIDFETTKSSYKQGEPITFTYDYENEEWESIVSEKWTYRDAKDAPNNYLFTKPTAIYTEGEYIVTLEVKDAYGNWSQKAQTIVEVTDDVLVTEFEDKFTQGQIGDTLDNFEKTNYQSYKEVEALYLEDTKGTMLMSNSPEVVGEKGLLYEDTITGEGRVLFHHINNFDSMDNQLDKKRLVVIAENRSEVPVAGTISKLTTKGPSDDVLFVGQQLLLEYFNNNSSQPLALEPGARKIIYDSQKKNWLKGQAISGMFDIVVEGPVTFTVALLGQNDKIEDIPLMPRPARDVHPRGTFDVLDKNIFVDLRDEDENTKLVIGKGADEWLTGYDALLQGEVANRGNFGINYHITITAQEDTAVILNPRGNMFKGAIKWEQDKGYLAPSAGYFPSSNRGAFVGVVKAGETKTLTYMLPNGSSAPVLFGFIPESNWR